MLPIDICRYARLDRAARYIKDSIKRGREELWYVRSVACLIWAVEQDEFNTDRSFDARPPPKSSESDAARDEHVPWQVRSRDMHGAASSPMILTARIEPVTRDR